jgi:hypothetical protein
VHFSSTSTHTHTQYRLQGKRVSIKYFYFILYSLFIYKTLCCMCWMCKSIGTLPFPIPELLDQIITAKNICTEIFHDNRTFKRQFRNCQCHFAYAAAAAISALILSIYLSLADMSSSSLLAIIALNTCICIGQPVVKDS